jgi:hypothetical protein
MNREHSDKEGEGKNPNHENSRREFLKQGSLWLAGHFVLLNGAVFAGAVSAKAASPDCGLQQNPLRVFKDYQCGTVNKEFGGYWQDFDCHLPAGKGLAHQDNDCGKQRPIGGYWDDSDCMQPSETTPRGLQPDNDCGLTQEGGGHYADSSCARLTPDADCTLSNTTNPPTYHQDAMCQADKKPDSSCGLMGDNGIRIQDGDCGQTWPLGTTADSTHCGAVNPQTSGTTEDTDCYVGATQPKMFIPPKSDLDCGLHNASGGLWVDWDKYARKRVG